MCAACLWQALHTHMDIEYFPELKVLLIHGHEPALGAPASRRRGDEFRAGSGGSFHGTSEAPPGFGLRQSSGALTMEASHPKAPEDWRSPRRCRAVHRFMVPMHDIEDV